MLDAFDASEERLRSARQTDELVLALCFRCLRGAIEVCSSERWRATPPYFRCLRGAIEVDEPDSEVVYIQPFRCLRGAIEVRPRGRPVVRFQYVKEHGAFAAVIRPRRRLVAQDSL